MVRTAFVIEHFSKETIRLLNGKRLSSATFSSQGIVNRREIQQVNSFIVDFTQNIVPCCTLAWKREGRRKRSVRGGKFSNNRSEMLRYLGVNK